MQSATAHCTSSSHIFLSLSLYFIAPPLYRLDLNLLSPINLLRLQTNFRVGFGSVNSKHPLPSGFLEGLSIYEGELSADGTTSLSLLCSVRLQAYLSYN
jgi:hypothetical protein